MKPALWTIRKLVTSVSVVQRWNQAVAVQYSAASAAIAASERQTSVSMSEATMREKISRASATIQAAIAGR